MAINNQLLALIAQGAQPRVADAYAKGVRTANALTRLRAFEEDRNSLARVTNAFATGGTDAAIQAGAGTSLLQELATLHDNEQQQENRVARREIEQQKLNRPLSTLGKLEADFRSGRVSEPAYRAKINSIGKGGTTVNVNTGNIPVGKKASNTLQGDSIASAALLGQTDRLTDLVDDEFLTFMGQAKGGFFNFRDKLGGKAAALSPSQKKFLTRQTKFVTTVERLFNAYRKEITGAAAAVQELERLKKSFLNTDMGPTQFRAALAEFQSELKRVFNLKTQLLQAGIPPNSEQLGRTLDALYLSGATNIHGDVGLTNPAPAPGQPAPPPIGRAADPTQPAPQGRIGQPQGDTGRTQGGLNFRVIEQ